MWSVYTFEYYQCTGTMSRFCLDEQCFSWFSSTFKTSNLLFPCFLQVNCYITYCNPFFGIRTWWFSQKVWLNRLKFSVKSDLECCNREEGLQSMLRKGCSWPLSSKTIFDSGTLVPTSYILDTLINTFTYLWKLSQKWANATMSCLLCRVCW